MATKFKVYYEGNPEAIVVTVKPKHILKIEKESGALAATAESTYKLAWYASGNPDTFETWLDGIEDIEPDEPISTSEDANPS